MRRRHRMKTEAEITTLLLASAALGRERGDTTALEQALADSLRLERDRADRAVAEATGSEYIYLLTIHDLREELEASRAAINLAIHKIEQTIAGQYPEGQALQSALEALRDAS
jgi:hypothetical protein